MEIHEIKTKLTLSQVLHHYQLKPDKRLRLHCPFHDDKTPSMQVYYKTHTAYCFSSNCKTHGKAIDVIDFIMYMEKLSKHAAILKAQEILAVPGAERIGKAIKKAESIINPGATTSQATAPTLQRVQGASNERAMFLKRMFTYFKNAVHNSKPAQEYLQSRCLEFRNMEIGYNAGQFHHGARKDETLINECLKYGLLLDLGMKSRTGDTAYKPFGKWCIVFALRNQAGEIVSLYFRSTLANKEQRHFYLRDRQGLYPNYPPAGTKKLILTESIIDAATLLQQPEIAGKYNLLALYGTNGLTEEHQTAIRSLTELDEIIFFLNGDAAGNKAVEKYAPMLKGDYPKVKITNVEVPENEDVNSLLQSHSPEILTHLIDTRKEVDFIFSNENKKDTQLETFVNTETEEAEKAEEPVTSGLNTNNPYSLKYTGKEASYQIKGFKTSQPDSLKITLQISVL